MVGELPGRPLLLTMTPATLPWSACATFDTGCFVNSELLTVVIGAVKSLTLVVP
ncbi:hypothetical protein D3C80_863400 [compost metagenome]